MKFKKILITIGLCILAIGAFAQPSIRKDTIKVNMLLSNGSYFSINSPFRVNSAPTFYSGVTFNGYPTFNAGLQVNGNVVVNNFGMLRLGSNASFQNLSGDLTFVDAHYTKTLSQLVTGGGGGSSYFSYTAPYIYPNNSSDNLVLGSTSPGAHPYKLWVSGGAYTNGSIKSIASDGDIDAYNFSTSYVNDNIVLSQNSSAQLYSISGLHNILIGNINGPLGTLSEQNVFIGTPPGVGNNMYRNTAVGNSSGLSLDYGNDNTLFGVSAGQQIDRGNNNVLIGNYAGQNLSGNGTTGEGCVMIGYSAGSSEFFSNRLYIANSSTATPLLYGIFPNQYFTIRADSVGIYGDIKVRKPTSPKIYFGSSFVGLTASKDLKINNNGSDAVEIKKSHATNNIYFICDSMYRNGVLWNTGGGGGSSSGLNGAIQLSDGAGGFTNDTKFNWDGTRLNIGSVASSNFLVGYQAGDNVLAGANGNTAVGYTALWTITTGDYNTAIGASSGGGSTGSNNTSIGSNAGASITSGHENAFIGKDAGFSNTTGTRNVAIGYQSSYNNDTASHIVSIGDMAGWNNISPRNMFIGYESGFSSTYGIDNTYIGRYSGLVGDGNFNVYVGNNSGFKSTGSNNTFIGEESNGKNNSPNGNGSSNTFLGYLSGYSTSTGYSNTFLGTGSGYSNTTGYHNILIGDSAGFNSVDKFGAISIGYNAGGNSTYTISIGNRAGANNTTDDNIFIGAAAGTANTTGSGIMIGRNSGTSNIDGSSNIFIGNSSGATNISGIGNVFLGNSSGYSNLANYNTFLGINTGYTNTTGYFNVNVGSISGYRNTTGFQNTYLGYRSGENTTTGHDNTYIGQYSGNSILSGSTNTLIGSFSGNWSGSTNSQSGVVKIGYNAGSNDTLNNKLYIANSNTTNPLIGGDFSTKELTVNALFNLGSTATDTLAGGQNQRAVSGSSYLEVTCSSVTPVYLNGLSGGKKGDIIIIARTGGASATNYVLVNNGTGAQPFINSAGVDNIIYTKGFMYFCTGNHWVQIGD